MTVNERLEGASPLTIFYSYAYEDEKLRDKLDRHLSNLRRQGVITTWHNRKIVAGSDKITTIAEQIDAASLILLLVSPDFIASNNCYIEAQRALERQQRGEVGVIPIILRPVDWDGTSFAHLQCLPTNEKPVTKWSKSDDAFFDIACGVRTVVEKMRFPSSPLRQSQSILLSSLINDVTEKKNFSRNYHQQRLLEKVDTIWIRGILDTSLRWAMFIPLILHEKPDIVVDPLVDSWQLTIQEIEQSIGSLALYGSILEAYDQASGELLILGEPGAGKTTLLLDLTRNLLHRAMKDASHPMPVVFNLSSWAVNRRKLTDWLVKELTNKYKVSRKLSRLWIKQEQILPLLDGLDEVSPLYRGACIRAINKYRQEHGLIPVVICSRSSAYLSQAGRIQLRQAITIQPLAREQVDDYFSKAQSQSEIVQAVLREDPILQELVTTPLMLSVLIQAFRKIPLTDILKREYLAGSAAEDLTVLKRQIFATYIEQMLKRRGVNTHYKQKQTVRWLVLLSQCLEQHNQTEFSLNDFTHFLSSKWLPKGWMRPIFRLLTGLIWGLLIGGGLGILMGFALRSVGLGIVVAVIMALFLGLSSMLEEGIVEGPLLGILLCWVLNYRYFLDYATECILLRKIGNTYMFVHPMILDYLATLDIS